MQTTTDVSPAQWLEQFDKKNEDHAAEEVAAAYDVIVELNEHASQLEAENKRLHRMLNTMYRGILQG